MRQWIENLAKVTKEEGYPRDMFIMEVKNIQWSLTAWDGSKNLCIRLIKEDKSDSIKIYEDEYDLLSSIVKYLRKSNQDYIINQLNNL